MRQPTSGRFVVCFGLAVAASVGAVVVGAQYAVPPDAYSLTQTMFATNQWIQVWRDGSKAVVDVTFPAGANGAKATPMSLTRRHHDERH
jgi:hypothetical protein